MKRRLLLLALTTLLLLQILHAFYFHRSFYQARQAGWLQEVPQVLYSAVPGQQLVNAFDGRKISFAELNRDENKFMAAIQERSTNQISLSQEEASQLYSLLQHFVAKLSPRAYFNLISCLGSIKTNSYQWKCDKEVTLLLEYLPLKLSDQTKSEDIAKTLLGLCRLGVSWSKIQVHRQMATAISEALLSSNEKLVSDIIWTLGTLGPNWKTLPVALQQNLMKAFEKNIVRMSPFTMSSSVWAMAKVGYPWTILSKETQKIVLDKVERFSRDFTPQQSSKVLWALGTMGISYQLLPLSVIKDLISRVGDIKKSKMGNAVSSSQMFIGLARIGIPWMALSSSSSSKEIMEQATRICQSSNTKGMLNCIWALGQMGVDRSAIYPELESLLFASAAKVMPDGNGWACINVLW